MLLNKLLRHREDAERGGEVLDSVRLSSSIHQLRSCRLLRGTTAEFKTCLEEDSKRRCRLEKMACRSKVIG